MNLKKSFYSYFFILFIISFILNSTIWTFPAYSMQNAFSKIPPSFGFQYNRSTGLKVQRPQRIFYSPYALPKGKNNFWYQLHNSPICEEEIYPDGVIGNEIGGLTYKPGVYAIEFPKKDGTIATRIGESDTIGRRVGQHRDALRLRTSAARAMQPYFDQLQQEFPEEKDWNGLVYPRFLVLETSPQHLKLSYRVKRESYYKEQVRRDPERILLNQEAY